MVGILTIEMGLPPEYVLDKMQMYEVGALLDYKYLKNKDTWEQTRWIGCLYANHHRKSRLSLENLVQFPWEKDKFDGERPVMTKKAAKALAKVKLSDFMENATVTSVTQKELNKMQITNGK